MLRAIVAIIGIVFISGCAMLAPVVERSAEKSADVVEWYCDNSTADQRDVYHADVNRRLPEGYGADITCPDD